MPVLIEAATGNTIVKFQYDIVNNPLNHIFVVYFSNSNLKIAKSVNEGASFTVVNTGVTASANGTVGAAYDNGTLHIAFRDGTSLKYVNSTDDGATFGTVVNVSAQTGVAMDGYNLGIDAFNNRVAILYQQTIANYGTQRINESTDGGLNWTEIFNSGSGGNISAGQYPVIRYDKSEVNHIYFTSAFSGGGRGFFFNSLKNGVYSLLFFTTTVFGYDASGVQFVKDGKLYAICLRGPTTIDGQAFRRYPKPIGTADISHTNTTVYISGTNNSAISTTMNKIDNYIYVGYTTNDNREGYLYSSDDGVTWSPPIEEFRSSATQTNRHWFRRIIGTAFVSCYFEFNTNNLYFSKGLPLENILYSDYLPNKYDQLVDGQIASLTTSVNVIKRKVDIVSPTASNDNTQGYGVGKVWVNNSLDQAYICVNNSTGAAVWKQITI